MKKRLLAVLFFCLLALTLSAQTGGNTISPALNQAADSLSVLIRQTLGNTRDNESLYLRGIRYNGESTLLGEYFDMLFLGKFTELGLSNISLFGQEVRPPAGTAYYTIEGGSFMIGASLEVNLSFKKYPENQILRVINFSLASSQDLIRLLHDEAQANTPPGGDAYEPNNSGSTAYPITEGRFDLSFTSGDQDWFSFQLSVPTMITLGTVGDIDTVIALYGPNSYANELASDDDSGDSYNARLNRFLSSPGTYYVQVRPYGSDTGGYTFFYEKLNIAADAAEPNNTQAQAATLDISQLPRAYSLFPEDDHDWFRLNLSSFLYRTGEVLSFYTSGDSDTYIEVYQGSEEITYNDDGFDSGYNARVSFSPERGSTYSLCVRGYSSNVVGEYTLHAETEIVALDQYEPNNTRATAGRISVGETQTDHSLSEYDYADWFMFDVTQAGNYAIGTTSGGSGSLDTVISLYDNNNNEIGGDDDSGENYNALLEIRLEPGTYYVELRQYGEDSGHYSFFVNRR